MATTKPIPEGWEPSAKPRLFNPPAPERKPIPEGWEEAKDPFSTERMGEVVGEAALGAGQGFISTVPSVAGAVSGLKLGLPFGPIPAVGGMVAGGVTGFFAGKSAEDAYKSFFPEPTDPTDKAFREGGKTFGSSLGFTAVAPYLPTMTGNRISQYLTSIRDAAIRNPKSFKTSEALGAFGAGVGGGIAESQDPGAPVSRLVGEVSGGLSLGLFRTLISQAGPMADGLKRLAGSVSASATESRAASRLSQILEDFGEDIPTLIRRLEADMPIDQLSVPGGKRVTPSAAQKTDSLGLTALESALGQTNKKFLADVREQGKQSAMAYQLLTDRLKSIGTPESLAMAAQLQEARFTSMIDGRLADADKIAALKISKITGDTPQARQAIGATIKEQTELALKDARDYESNLWKNALNSLTKPVKKLKQTRVPMQGAQAQSIFDRTGIRPKVTITDEIIEAPSIDPTNTANSFLERASNVGPALYDSAIPKAVRDIMDAMGVNQDSVKRFRSGRRTQQFIDTGEIPLAFMPKTKPIGVDDLVNYRSTLLNMAREAAGKGEVGNASLYGNLAEGMLQDLNSLKNPQFEEARQFSKSLNDVFTRSFANTVGGATGTGAERLPAEILVKRAFGANADMTAMRMNELEDAVKFMSNQYDSAVARFGANSPQAAALKPAADVSRAGAASMADAQQRVLRMGAAAAIDTTFDPATGREVTRLNTTKLKKFVAENKPMLDKLGITPDLNDAVKAENAFRMVQNENSALMKRAADQYAFGQVLKLGGERPSLAIGNMLNGTTPVRDMKNLVKMATDSDTPEAAIRGLKHSLYDYAYTKATGPNGKFNAQAFEDAFFKPVAPNQPSVVNIMRANGLMTLTEMKNIKRLVDPMIRIESAMASGRLLDEVVPGSNAVEELMQRVIGARIGSAAAPSGPGTLIAAAAGSKAVRSIFDKMPNVSTVAVMERAAQDPAFMAMLLKRTKTEQEKIMLGRQLHSYMLSAGLNYATYEEPEPATVNQSPFTPQGRAAQELRQFNESLRQTEERQRQQRQSPPAPSTRGVPGLNPTPSAPSQPGASNAPANSSARSMMQSLFPFDAISGMAAQQQQPPAPR
jgi:hypothetical protein